MSAVGNSVLVLAAIVLLVALNELRGPFAAYRALRRDQAAASEAPWAEQDAPADRGQTDAATASELLRREIRDAGLWLAVAAGLAVIAIFVIR